jgi:hypothetical protein
LGKIKYLYIYIVLRLDDLGGRRRIFLCLSYIFLYEFIKNCRIIGGVLYNLGKREMERIGENKRENNKYKI